jgi:hypothetical protein
MNKIGLAMLFLAALLSSVQKRQYDPPEPKSYALAMIDKGKHLLKDGDLVVRLHNSPVSAIVRDFNREDKSYSHAGIVLIENGCPMVYHIMISEDNRKGVIRKDSLPLFCNPAENTAYGIYRYQLRSNELARAGIILQQWFEKKIIFDPLFDLQTDEQMYCSEMVAKLIGKATEQRITIKATTMTLWEQRLFRTKYHLPDSCGRGGKLYSIDNLYLNSSCNCVMKFNF